MLDLIRTTNARMDHAWMPLAFHTGLEAAERSCFACGGTARMHLGRIGFDREVPRRLTACPRCSIVEDAPADSMFKLSLHDKTLWVDGVLPATRCAGAIFVLSRLRRESLWCAWPRTPTGSLAPSIPLDRWSWPPGPLEVGVILAWDARIAALKCPARRPHALEVPLMGERR
jgi:hypothetical protein